MSTIWNPEAREDAEDNWANAWGPKHQAGLIANIRADQIIKFDDNVFFWRDGQEWIGTGTLRELHHIVNHIEQKRTTKKMMITVSVARLSCDL